MTVNGGPVFEIKSKPKKQSLQFQVATSDGLSSRLGGILGINMLSSKFKVNEADEQVILNTNQQIVQGMIDKYRIILPAHD